uniref:Glutamine synthetase n=1 Tax=Aplanochytrium stocchinoi TaxID=215587 RepID=A0A7S3V1U4_9STRA|mmetsp:Transcript_8509/g.10019  ORF Transcript_8509/g.10019 Transcript_8509/m.10019 type:complete len:417 (+) Transcript_8509:293-1543(+)|eukprot:CAMPEP_0204829566 /NCGR_PEP_ID=MMETSP1346-20131115/7809_1 /ASSEMBLY_ACC=CAM_ASM_000771 /TAXON_ID=215587 /ORGANISM="Aplanochytrium stocchinoi, Strain GSBS06" /LENGTH=416 /DNA_ID=CAMNT_0051959479 /DNA_START=215 /DNA_END=1465 /DNA_ORIENTATION=-
MAATNYVKAEYIWIDAVGGYRSKTKIIHGKTKVTLKDLSKWNYDGSSTGQAPGADSEVTIVPRAVFPDPFRRNGGHVLVMTDTYDKDGNALPTNSRFLADKVFADKPKEEPWFGIEQEYTMFQDGRPLGWPKSKARTFGGSPTATYGYPAPQGPYYCSAGADVAFGRDIVEEHLESCAYAGIIVSGVNAEVMPGQWEFQVGPCTGIQSGDHMSVARYILNRVAEKHGVMISYHPKPIPGDWNGAGCHTNFSTKPMRGKNGYKKHIIPAIENLGLRHQQHINAYGQYNDQRLTGKHETGSIEKFSWDVADRGCSVRVPNATRDDNSGYFEDRRPASNMDPYIVTAMIFDSAILNGKFASDFDSIKTEGVDIPAVEREKAPAVETAADATLDQLEKEAAVAPGTGGKKKKKKGGCKSQ